MDGSIRTTQKQRKVLLNLHRTEESVMVQTACLVERTVRASCMSDCEIQLKSLIPACESGSLGAKVCDFQIGQLLFESINHCRLELEVGDVQGSEVLQP